MVTQSNKARALSLSGAKLNNFRNLARLKQVSREVRNGIKDIRRNEGRLALKLAENMDVETQTRVLIEPLVAELRETEGQQRAMIQNRIRAGLSPSSQNINDMVSYRQSLMNRLRTAMEATNFSLLGYTGNELHNKAIRGRAHARKLVPHNTAGSAA